MKYSRSLGIMYNRSMDNKNEPGQTFHPDDNNQPVAKPVNDPTINMDSGLSNNLSASQNTSNEEIVAPILSAAPTRKSIKLIILSIFIVISVIGAASYVLLKDSNSTDNTPSLDTVNESSNDVQSIISKLVLVDFEKYSSMSISERDQIRQDIGDLWRLAIDSTFSTPPKANEINDAADDFYKEYYSGSSKTYRNMFAAGTFISGTSGSTVKAGGCSDVASDEFRVTYDDELGTLGSLYICLESGDVYTAEKQLSL